MTVDSLSTTQIVSICVFVAILLFEMLFPFREYVGRLRHFGKNMIFALMNAVITGLSAAVMSIWVFLWIDKNDIGLLNQFEIPWWLSMLLAALIFDAWIYWWHRLNHIVPFFWRFHQVHHNDIEMDMSTALRFHPGEILLSSIANVGIFVLFGITVELIVFYKLVFHLNVLFHHSNIALPSSLDRFMRIFLVSPNMHRVHHSRKIEETNSNYSSALTLWDRIFGSYRRNDPSTIVFGLDHDRKPEEQGLKYLLLRPFKPRISETPPPEASASPDQPDNP
jgi:sterol desaturase/sphingolipid hydroxylase (fatty acid hydroxylase superfamily)